MVITNTDSNLSTYNDEQLRRLYFYNEGNSTVQSFFAELTNYLTEHDLKIEVYFNNTKGIHLYNLYVLPNGIERAAQARYVEHDIAHMSTTGPWVKTEKSSLFRQFVRLFNTVKEAVESGEDVVEYKKYIKKKILKEAKHNDLVVVKDTQNGGIYGGSASNRNVILSSGGVYLLLTSADLLENPDNIWGVGGNCESCTLDQIVDKIYKMW